MKPFPGWELHDRRIEEEQVIKEGACTFRPTKKSIFKKKKKDFS